MNFAGSGLDPPEPVVRVPKAHLLGGPCRRNGDAAERCKDRAETARKILLEPVDSLALSFGEGCHTSISSARRLHRRTWSSSSSRVTVDLTVGERRCP